MKSTATQRFWTLFHDLPADVQSLAVKNYHLWLVDPTHRSLRFRRLQGSRNTFTIRIGDHYRALGTVDADAVTWIWIGTHARYDQLTGSK